MCAVVLRPQNQQKINSRYLLTATTTSHHCIYIRAFKSYNFVLYVHEFKIALFLCYVVFRSELH